jgi:periplasmic protein TonB
MKGIATRLATVVLFHALLFYAVLQVNPELKKAIEPLMVSLITPPQPLPLAPPPPQSPPRPAPAQPRPQPVAQPQAPRVPETPVPNAITTETVLPERTPSAPSQTPDAAPPAVAAPAKTAVAAVVPPRFDAAYLNNPAPPYPAAARRRGEGGRVQLRVLVTAAGRASRVEVSSSSGSALLDEAAKDAVERWRFQPARRGDEVIDAWVIVPIVFSLEG